MLFLIFIVIDILLPHEVFGAFVLVRTTIVLVSPYRLMYVSRRKFVQLLIVAKDDDGNIDGAEHRELMGLFEESTFALEKGH